MRSGDGNRLPRTFCNLGSKEPRIARNRDFDIFCIETVENGQMTKDLALLVSADQPYLTTDSFLDALDVNLQKAMAS